MNYKFKPKQKFQVLQRHLLRRRAPNPKPICGCCGCNSTVIYPMLLSVYKCVHCGYLSDPRRPEWKQPNHYNNYRYANRKTKRVVRLLRKPIRRIWRIWKYSLLPYTNVSMRWCGWHGRKQTVAGTATTGILVLGLGYLHLSPVTLSKRLSVLSGCGIKLRIIGVIIISPIRYWRHWASYRNLVVRQLWVGSMKKSRTVNAVTCRAFATWTGKQSDALKKSQRWHRRHHLIKHRQWACWYGVWPTSSDAQVYAGRR